MESSPFKTSDQGLAAYLLYCGIELIGCVPSGEDGRLFFVFSDTPEREGRADEWTGGYGPATEVKKFFSKVKQTRRELRNPVTE